MSLNLGEITTTLTIDRSQLSGELDSVRRDFDRLDQSGEEAADGIRRSMGRAGDSTEQISRGTRSARTDLDRMGTAGRDAASDIQRESRRAAQEVEDIGQAGGRARRGLERVGEGLGNVGERAGSEMGGGLMAGLAAKVAMIGGKGGPIGLALAGVAGIGLGAGAVLMGAIQDGMNQIQFSNNMQAALGVDDSQMAKIGKAAGDSYVRAFGDSVQGNMDTAASLTQFGLVTGDSTSADIQHQIEQVSVLNGIMKEETPETLRGLNSLIKNGYAKDMTEAADLMTVAAQRGVNSQGDLIDSLSEYGSGWQQTGFSAKYALALIDQSMENGVDNSDRAADAIREFGRRTYENADEMKDVYKELGFNAEEMYSTFTKGGPEAEKAFDDVFDAIRKIEDPSKRAAAAQALLGDTAGDFIDAYTKWDPSAAVANFGEVAGAAQKASDVMGSGGAAKMESAMRTLETASNDVKVALAEAFAPLIEDVGNWVASHRGELIQFFTDLAAGALDMGSAIAHGISDAMGSFEGMYKGIAAIVEKISGLFETVLRGAAKVADFLGQDKDAEMLNQAADAMGKLNDAAAKAPEVFDRVQSAYDSAGDKLSTMADKVRAAGTQSADAARLATALGDAIFSIPNGKDIIVTSNSPEQQAKLEALGLKVEQLPDGNFIVTANTDEGQQVVDNFIAANNGKTIFINTQVSPLPSVQIPAPGSTKSYDGTIVGGLSKREGGVMVESYATGGVRRSGFGGLPASAEIKGEQRSLINWSEPGTGGEAFIPLGPTNRPKSQAVWLETGKRLGYSAAALGFLAASAFSADGSFTGKFDTGSTDIAPLSAAADKAQQAYASQGAQGATNIGMVNYGPVTVDDAALEARLKQAQAQGQEQMLANIGG